MTLAASVLSRRVFLTTAGTALGGIVFVQAAQAEDAPVTAPAPASEPTPEGKALAESAIASAGHPLTPDDKAEVEKQLSSYPSSNGDLRRFHIGNGVGPSISVTSAIHNRKP